MTLGWIVDKDTNKDQQNSRSGTAELNIVFLQGSDMTDTWFTDSFPNNHIYSEPDLIDPRLRMSIPNEEARYGHMQGSSSNANAFHVSPSR